MQKYVKLFEEVFINPSIKDIQPFEDYVEAKETANSLHDDFLALLKNVGIGQVITDIKSRSSFYDKVENRGKDIKKIHDVLRGAILVDSKEDIHKVVKWLIANSKIQKVDYKTKPEGPFGYFGPVHIDVLVDDMLCEVQVMTKKLWKYKEKTDEFYSKYRSSDEIPKEEIDKCKRLFVEANR